MSQRKYALHLLQCANVLNHKPSTIPLDPAKNLNLIDGDPLPDLSLYRKLVGKLIYVTFTRPHLSFAAQALSQFSHQPTTTYMDVLYRVLRCIKLCPGQGLHFVRTNNLCLSAYCDSDWAACPITRSKAIHGDDGKMGVITRAGSKSCWMNIVHETNTLLNKGGTLKNRYPRLYALESSKSITVGMKVAQPSLAFSFRRAPRGGVEQEQFDEIVALVNDVILAPISDRWTWTLEIRNVSQIDDSQRK
ncbi:RNA-directed DNA polymerase, eukaryota, reverse transcriptase zinc-binding domain protein [Tanacetum coccineum]